MPLNVNAPPPVSALKGPPKNLASLVKGRPSPSDPRRTLPGSLPQPAPSNVASILEPVSASTQKMEEPKDLSPAPAYGSFDNLAFYDHLPVDSTELDEDGNPVSGIVDALGLPVKSPLTKTRVLPPPFISKLKKIDSVTRKWLRNATDERAASESNPSKGIYPMKFNPVRGEHFILWVDENIRIYEGDFAGQSFEFMDWQYDAGMRLFSWVRWSEERQRWVRRFRYFSGWYPKKTGKTPFLPTIGHYIFAGESEQGNKCFSIAYDHNQAMLAHEHAVAMVEMAKEQGTQFGRDCTISYTTKTITHIPSRSKYIVSSGDKQDRGGRAKEGYNGSLFIDETHVMNERYIKRLERAGIARREPLMVEMSTAGLEKDGYGFARCQYGRKVHTSPCVESDGDLYDPSLLFIEYSAPQNLDIEDLKDESKIDDYIRVANPSIGHILTFEQAHDEWRRDKGKGQEALRDFGVYRLNIWMDTTESWLAMSDWNACSFPYTFEDIREFPCILGLDLSKTRDMSSANLEFAVPESNMRKIIAKNGGDPDRLSQKMPLDLPPSISKHIDMKTIKPGKRVFCCQWPLYWMPESAIDRYSHAINFGQWRDQIQFTRAEVIDYDAICETLTWLKRELDLLGIAYDAYEAAKVVSVLVEQRHWNPEFFIIVKQNLYSMGPLTLDYERGIISHDILNPGCPVLTWQANHVEILREKHSDLRRPVKPEAKDSYKKVDGIVAGIIGRAAWNTHEKQLTGSRTTSFLLFPKGTKNPYEGPKAKQPHGTGRPNAAR